MDARLNLLRDEVQLKFLEPLGPKKHTVEKMIVSLEEELSILKSSANDKAKFGHQIYDMLFILLGLAAQHDVDLDEQWANGWAKKEKYLSDS
jgi:hypothetical protein